MLSHRGELVTETFAYDGGRQVTASVPDAAPEAVIYAAGHENDGTLFKGPRSIDEVKLFGPILYVKLYGATDFKIQYTNYRQIE